MKRSWSIFISVVLLLLSWAALDDITTGNEAKYHLEWMFISLTIAWFGGILAARIRHCR